MPNVLSRGCIANDSRLLHCAQCFFVQRSPDLRLVLVGLHRSMTRPLQRGSATSRFAENGWSQDETPVLLQANGKEERDCHGKASLLILLSGALKRGLSSQKFQQKPGEDVLRSSSRTQESGMSEDVFALKSFLGGSHSDKSFFTQLPEVSSLSFHTSLPTSSFGLSNPVQNKRGLSSPLAKIIMLLFISIFVLVAVLGSTSMGYSASSAPRIIYSSYRRLQEDFSSLDLTSGGIFGLGALRPKELIICPKDMEHHVPCYNVSSAIKGGLRNGEEHDRHCELSEGRIQCLIRPPKNYSLPLRWPHSKNAVWSGNTKTARDFKEARMERIVLGEDNMITFQSQDDDGAERHFREIATVLGIPDDSSFSRVGIRTVLDIGCSYGSFVAHLLARNLVTLCVALYEAQSSQVQVALDRGLPAMIGSLMTRQFPYPESSFNMIHCADCEIDWSQKDGLLLFEIDRLLAPDGYFVWTPPIASQDKSSENVGSEQKLKSINEVAKNMCWVSFPHQDRAFVWRKTANRVCSSQLSNTTLSICDDDENADIVAYRSLRHCLAAAKDGALLSVQPLYLPSSVFGFSSEELSDDSAAWLGTVKSYWSSITPLLFSDHPKRPAEDDPLPPSNILRNVMDMNALYGGFNAALLQAGKSVWVMNVIPTSGPNTLPIIYKRGFIGALHNWCEAFPTYPRTYDLLHAIGLLSQQVKHKTGCRLSNLFLEMDRILRPEGWVLLRDSAELIEEARVAASQMRWEARVIEVEGDSDLRLIVCQKVFWKS